MRKIVVVVVLLCENSLVLVKYKGKQHWKKNSDRYDLPIYPSYSACVAFVLKEEDDRSNQSNLLLVINLNMS